MHRKSVIVIEYETREHMKDVAKKSQTYDDLINELLRLKLDSELKERSQGWVKIKSLGYQPSNNR